MTDCSGFAAIDTSRGNPSSPPTEGNIRVTALMEASSITGPAKNLIEFATRASQPRAGRPRLELSIVTFERGDERGNTFICYARSAGLTVDVIRERSAFDPLVLPQLRSMVARRAPQVIQSHAVKSHFLVRLSGLHRRLPWIAFHHGYTWPDLKMRVYNQFDRFSLPAADQVVTVCRAFAPELERFGVRRERIVVRHNMVLPFVPSPPDEVAQLRRVLGIPGETAMILAVGRLSREKGHIDLIEAVSSLRTKCAQPFRVVIAGDGPERSALARRAGVLGISELVLFAGHQNDLRPYYSAADIMVLPSHSEGSPNVLLEAFAAGLPTVATRVGGVPEIAAHGESALLVEKASPGELATGVSALLCDGSLRGQLGSAAKQCAAAYTPQCYTSAVLQLYEQVLRRVRIAP